jgi:HEAT repeat protein
MLLCLAILLTATSAAFAAQPKTEAPALPEVTGPVAQFKAAAEGPVRTAAQLDTACAAIVAAALPAMESEDPLLRGVGQSAIEDLAFFVSRPGAEAERLALSKALAAKVGAAKPLAQVWMCRMMQQLGNAECVPALATVLTSTDSTARDAARRALQKNPAPEAGTALLADLASTEKPDVWVTGLDALGYQPADAAATAAAAAKVTPFLAHQDGERVASAAAYALGRMGGPEAVAALTATWLMSAQVKTGNGSLVPLSEVAKFTGGPGKGEFRVDLDAAKVGAIGLKAADIPGALVDSGKRQGAMLDALLMCAERFVRQGKLEEASVIYHNLDNSLAPPRIQRAVLRGTILTGGEKALPTLTAALTGTDPAMRGFALSLLGEVRGPAAAKALAELMPKLTPSEQTILLGELAGRSDPAVKPAVLESLKSSDEGVRTAAARAMATLGDASDVPLLATLAAATEGRSAAFDTLVGLRGDNVDTAMVLVLARVSDAKMRAVLIRAVAARKTAAAVPAVLNAASDPDESVRIEAAGALAVLGDESAIKTLVDVIVNAKSDAERKAAEKAAVAIAVRSTKKDACAASALKALAAIKTGEARASLLTVLGPTGTKEALAALRAALKEAETLDVTAAITALGSWPDQAPAPDLLALAKSDAAPARQILALRSYVRLAGKGDQPAADRAKMYEEALAAAKRPEDRSMVLSEMGNSPSAAALAVIRPLLASADSKNEAAAAIVKIAGAVAATSPDEAAAALQQTIDSSADEAIKRQARQALATLKRPARPAAVPGKTPTKS